MKLKKWSIAVVSVIFVGILSKIVFVDLWDDIHFTYFGLWSWVGMGIMMLSLVYMTVLFYRENGKLSRKFVWPYLVGAVGWGIMLLDTFKYL